MHVLSRNIVRSSSSINSAADSAASCAMFEKSSCSISETCLSSFIVSSRIDSLSCSEQLLKKDRASASCMPTWPSSWNA